MRGSFSWRSWRGTKNFSTTAPGLSMPSQPLLSLYRIACVHQEDSSSSLTCYPSAHLERAIQVHTQGRTIQVHTQAHAIQVHTQEHAIQVHTQNVLSKCTPKDVLSKCTPKHMISKCTLRTCYPSAHPRTCYPSARYTRAP